MFTTYYGSLLRWKLVNSNSWTETLNPPLLNPKTLTLNHTAQADQKQTSGGFWQGVRCPQ